MRRAEMRDVEAIFHSGACGREKNPASGRSCVRRYHAALPRRFWEGKLMAYSAEIVDALKRELKSRGVTYAALARKLRLSEATLKRMFSRRDFTLKRLDDICAAAQIDFSDLARGLARE